MSIYYESPLGSSSASTGFSDFLLVSALSYHNSLGTYKNAYIPYIIEHTSTNEWEYGLGIVIDNGGQDVLIRGGSLSYPLTKIYSSSNNNTKVDFSAGTKNVKTVISSERIKHGGNNYSYKTSSFIADTVQTTYGVFTSGSSLNAMLPPASGNENLILSFRLLKNSSHSLNILASGSSSIDGLSSTTLTPAEQYTSFISNGSDWYEIIPTVDVSGSGLPQGSVGSIQFKDSSVAFGGNNNLYWHNTSGLFMVGGSSVSSANIVLSNNSTNIINNQKNDTDFIVRGTGNNVLYFDASTGRLGVNTSSPSTILHVVGRCANDTLKIESTTECPTGVALTLLHNPNTGSSTGDYPATINFAGRNSNGQQVNFAQIRSKILGTDLSNTSGELAFNVDQYGQSKNIATFNVGSINLGLNSSSPRNSNNISIGQLSKDSGTNNILIGHSGFISGLLSYDNFVAGHFSTNIGYKNISIGNNSLVSGNNIYSIGHDANITSSRTYNFGTNNNISGESNFVVGSGNNTNSSFSFIIGHNNSNINNKNFIFGDSVNVSGTSNTLCGTSIQVTGHNNISNGINNTVIGSGNTINGSSNSIVGSGNIIYGDNISGTGVSSIALGKNLALNNSNNTIVLGSSNNTINIDSSGFVFNSGVGSSSFIVYGNNSNSGLFYRNNNLGLNKLANNNYVLDVNGNISSTGLYTNNFKLGLSSVSGSVLLSDSSGNAQWANPSTLASSIASNFFSELTPEAVIVGSGSRLSSSTGLYWNSTSGLYLSSSSGINNAFFVASTGNIGVVINNNFSSGNVLTIKDSSNNNLLLADATNKRIGINITPAVNFHVSGVSRLQNSSLDYVEKNTNQFTILYDNDGSTKRNWQITSSGLFVSQTNDGSLIPSTSDSNNTRLLVLELDSTARHKVKYITSLGFGYVGFTGTSDS